MEYKCSVCGKILDADLKGYIDHTEKHIIEKIKEKHPQWVEEDGVCKKCIEYYRKEIKGE